MLSRADNVLATSVVAESGRPPLTVVSCRTLKFEAAERITEAEQLGSADVMTKSEGFTSEDNDERSKPSPTGSDFPNRRLVGKSSYSR